MGLLTPSTEHYTPGKGIGWSLPSIMGDGGCQSTLRKGKCEDGWHGNKVFGGEDMAAHGRS